MHAHLYKHVVDFVVTLAVSLCVCIVRSFSLPPRKKPQSKQFKSIVIGAERRFWCFVYNVQQISSSNPSNIGMCVVCTLKTVSSLDSNSQYYADRMQRLL